MRYELVRGGCGRGPRGLACNAPGDSGSHEGCWRELESELWTPCLSCLGGGVVIAGGELCPDCLGLGF